jgi:hypothetical protein
MVVRFFMGAPRYILIRASRRRQCDQDWLSEVKFCKSGDAFHSMELLPENAINFLGCMRRVANWACTVRNLAFDFFSEQAKAAKDQWLRYL